VYTCTKIQSRKASCACPKCFESSLYPKQHGGKVSDQAATHSPLNLGLAPLRGEFLIYATWSRNWALRYGRANSYQGHPDVLSGLCGWGARHCSELHLYRLPALSPQVGQTATRYSASKSHLQALPTKKPRIMAEPYLCAFLSSAKTQLRHAGSQ